METYFKTEKRWKNQNILLSIRFTTYQKLLVGIVWRRSTKEEVLSTYSKLNIVDIKNSMDRTCSDTTKRYNYEVIPQTRGERKI